MSKLVTSTGIPASWTLIPLKDLGDWSGGGTPSKAKPQYWQGGSVPWVSPKDMKTERISNSEDHITKEAIAHSTASLIKAGSVLIVTRSGILRHTLPVAVSAVAVTVNQDLKALTPRNGIMAEYVAWALRAFARDILNTCSKQGTTVNSVETVKLLRFEIPVAPTEQQHTIVAEIEKQFSRLDEAVANLKRVKANLKRYKAAVLKAAVEGKLTEEWRKQHPDVEPASKLLERIIKERPHKGAGKGEYKDPVEPNTTSLGSIPNSWIWAALDQLCPLFVDSPHRTPRYGQTGVPALGPRDVVGGRLNVTDARLVDEGEYATQTERHVPEAGDIVYSRELSLGWGVILPPGSRVCLSQGMCLFRPHKTVDSRYFMIVLNGPHGRRQAELAATGSAHPHVNLGSIKKYSIPLPPSPEQEKIVAEVERRLSVIDELEATVEANLTRADRLRQSVLQQAFTGQLVPENPNTVPVSGLIGPPRLQSAFVEPTNLPSERETSIQEVKNTMNNLIEALPSASGWISAQEAFRLCGIGAGTETDTIERIYEELRGHIDSGRIAVDRRGEADWLCLFEHRGA